MVPQVFSEREDNGLTSLRFPTDYVLGVELAIPADTEQLLIKTGTLAASVFKSLRPYLDPGSPFYETIGETEGHIGVWEGDTITSIKVEELSQYSWSELQVYLQQQRSALPATLTEEVITGYDHLIQMCGSCAESMAISQYTLRLVGDPGVVAQVLCQLGDEFLSIAEEAQEAAAEKYDWSRSRGNVPGTSQYGFVPPSPSLLPGVVDAQFSRGYVDDDNIPSGGEEPHESDSEAKTV